MVQKSKWIHGIDPDDPVSEAARYTLQARLNLVWHWLEPAAKVEPGNPEPVHQLRVASRRAKAALSSYDAALPRRAKWMKKQIKHIRQAAGDARDYDVLAGRLEPRVVDTGGADWRELLDRVRDRRQKAQKPIDEVYARLRKRHFQRRIGELVSRIRWRANVPAEPSFSVAARWGLRQAFEQLFSTSARLFDDIPTLHAFRIQAKQLRYVMEMFYLAFDPSFRTELYPQIEQLQEKIGAVIDHATARDEFQQWLDQPGAEDLAGPLKELLAEEQAAVQRRREEFFDWWNDDRKRELRARFDALVDAPAQPAPAEGH